MQSQELESSIGLEAAEKKRKRQKVQVSASQREVLKRSEAAKRPAHELSNESITLLDMNNSKKRGTEEAEKIPKKLVSIIEEKASAITSITTTMPAIITKNNAVTEHAKLVMERKQSALHCYLRACWMRLSRHHLQEMID